MCETVFVCRMYVVKYLLLLTLTGVFSATFPDGGVAAGVRKSTGAVGSLTVANKEDVIFEYTNLQLLQSYFRVVEYS